MNFTVLQSTIFMQTLADGWKEMTERDTLSLPYANDKQASYVDYRDVADAAAIALTSDKLDYGTFELCAPGMVNRIELTQTMSEVLGRTITPRELPSSSLKTAVLNSLASPSSRRTYDHAIRDFID